MMKAREIWVEARNALIPLSVLFYPTLAHGVPSDINAAEDQQIIPLKEPHQTPGHCVAERADPRSWGAELLTKPLQKDGETFPAGTIIFKGPSDTSVEVDPNNVPTVDVKHLPFTNEGISAGIRESERIREQVLATVQRFREKCAREKATP